MQLESLLIIVLVVIILYLLKRNFERKFTEDSFLSVVNHVFRTPLTSIKWMSEKLADEIPRKEQIEISHNLSNSVNRLMGVLDTLAGIKDIHNASSYDLKAVSLREILEEAIRRCGPQITEKKITLQVPTFENMPLLSIDTKKIAFVIHAILENAIWYSSENGAIEINAGVRNGYIVISIEDIGIGLLWKDRMNIFKRFYRGEQAKKINTDGMGLSLYMAREIIKRHKGTIYARSKGNGKGTIFYLKLPVTK